VRCLCCSKRVAEAEATVTALRQPFSRSARQSASLLQANGASSIADDSVALDELYTLGAAKKGLKKLRDQLDQDVTKWVVRDCCEMATVVMAFLCYTTLEIVVNIIITLQAGDATKEVFFLDLCIRLLGYICKSVYLSLQNTE